MIVIMTIITTMILIKIILMVICIIIMKSGLVAAVIILICITVIMNTMAVTRLLQLLSRVLCLWSSLISKCFGAQRLLKDGSDFRVVDRLPSGGFKLVPVGHQNLGILESFRVSLFLTSEPLQKVRLLSPLIMVHIETQKVKVLRANLTSFPERLAPVSLGSFRGFGFQGLGGRQGLFWGRPSGLRAWGF